MKTAPFVGSAAYLLERRAVTPRTYCLILRVSGHIVTPLRAHLNPDKVDMLVFLTITSELMNTVKKLTY